MLTLEEAIKQYEQFLNVCENHNPTEESQEVIEQLSAELRELQESKKSDGCDGYVKEFDKRYLLVIKQLAAWLRELKERRKAPEIITFGKCKHYKIDHPKANGYHCCYRCHNIFPMKEDDFCSRAERRTNDQARC